MFDVQDADHFFFLDHERSSRRNRDGRSYAKRLSGKTSFSEKIARAQDRDDRFLAGFVHYRKPYRAFLNVENVFGRITLREYSLFFRELRDLARYARRIEEILGVEGGSGIGSGIGFGMFGSLR